MSNLEKMKNAIREAVKEFHSVPENLEMFKKTSAFPSNVK